MPVNRIDLNPLRREYILHDEGLDQRNGAHTRAVDQKALDAAIKKYAAPLNSGLLPPAVRWISPTGRACILERPPTIARVGYRPARAGNLAAGQAVEYHLPVPWQVYGVVFDQTFTRVLEMDLYFRTSPIFTMEDPLSMFFYPNSFNDGRICLGYEFQANFRAEGGNLGRALSTAVNSLWTIDFNEDAGEQSWEAEWRCPTQYMPRDLRVAIHNGNVHKPDLLDFYANTPLERMLTWNLPPAHTMTGMEEVDTVAHLVKRLNRVDENSRHPLRGARELMTWMAAMFVDASRPAPRPPRVVHAQNEDDDYF